jgi:hypothetical protein
MDRIHGKCRVMTLASLPTQDIGMRPRGIVAFEKACILIVLLGLLHFVYDMSAHPGPSIMRKAIIRLAAEAMFLAVVLFVSRGRSR